MKNRVLFGIKRISSPSTPGRTETGVHLRVYKTDPRSHEPATQIMTSIGNCESTGWCMVGLYFILRSSYQRIADSTDALRPDPFRCRKLQHQVSGVEGCWTSLYVLCMYIQDKQYKNHKCHYRTEVNYSNVVWKQDKNYKCQPTLLT